MAKRNEDSGDVAEVDRAAEPTPSMPARTSPDKVRLAVTHGRGGRGKTTLVRVLLERATNAGREVALADADRTNATLAAFFKGVIRPQSPDDQTVYLWLDNLVNAAAEDRTSILLDMGGGDQVFKRFAKELDLVTLLDEVGIVPVALHLFGPDVDDLAYLDDIETTGAFCPPQTVLVLNEGLIMDGRPREAAFEHVRTHSIYRKALDRGAREIWIPKLGCMQEINESRWLFSDAETRLGLTNRQWVKMWRREVEKALQPVADWLP